MSVRIGHASLAETGGVYGSPGDQTGREVCVANWYPNSWQFIAIHPDPNVREKHAKAVEAACANDNIGYSWDNRNSLYSEAKKVGMDISKIRTKCNCDCSSLQNCCAVASGAPGVTYGSNGWVTTNMLGYLRSAGYSIIQDTKYLTSDAYCVRGAIYVSSGHTLCSLENGSKAAEIFSIAGLKGSATESKPVTQPAGPAVTIEIPVKEAARTCSPKLPVLINGAENGFVKSVQILLGERGYYCGGAINKGTKKEIYDGEFGPQTEASVKEFQKKSHITADGVVGANTWAALLDL